MSESFEQSFPVHLARLVQLHADKLDWTIPDDTEQLLRGVLTSRRDGDSTVYRMLKHPRKSATDRERCLLKLYQWHTGIRGGFNLWTPMTLVHTVDDYDAIDNVAHILCFVFTSRTSRAGDAWGRALGNRG